ncbi:unnamed protein product [Ranitomeya imitator]|uniref:TNF receptor-associated factor 3 n=1 Tax=Ranitomeya imitator TaxID=111125 RepID=A0ABN9ME57_9NEOB|nr:unnamed protein product [Ranitomeya imitator]
MDTSKRIEQQTLQQRADRSLATTIFVPEQGGYKEKFLKLVEEKYKCEKCRLVLCNPRQTECGHRYCETCMNLLISSPSAQCTACEEIIIKDKRRVAVASATQRRRAPMFNIGDACVFLHAFSDTCVVLDASVGRKKTLQVAFFLRPISSKNDARVAKRARFCARLRAFFPCVARCVADAGRRNASVFKDNCCRREVLALQMYCRNESRGCKEQISLGTLLLHLKSDCQFEELSCPRADCKEKVIRKDLSDHIEKTCKYRETPCQYCKNQVPLVEMQISPRCILKDEKKRLYYTYPVVFPLRSGPMDVAVWSSVSHFLTMTSSSCLHAQVQAYFVCPAEGRAKYCSAQAPGKIREARRLRTAVLSSALNREDKVRLRQSRSVKTRRGRHRPQHLQYSPVHVPPLGAAVSSAVTVQAEGGAHTNHVIAPSDLNVTGRERRRHSGAQRRNADSCDSFATSCLLQMHEDMDCPSVVVSCPHKCSVKSLLRSELNSHLSECVNAPSTCGFKRYGCSFKGTNQQIKAHEASSAVQHVNLMKEWSSFLETKVSKLQNETSDKNKSIQLLHNQMCTFEVEIERHKELLRNNEAKIHQLQVSIKLQHFLLYFSDYKTKINFQQENREKN